MIRADAAIIGGGPAGLVAAYSLARQGIKVALLEKDTYPREKTCGDGVTGYGLKVLQRMGLGEWLKRYPTFDLLRLSSPDGKFLDIPVPIPEGDCYGRTIPRREMDAEMARSAVGAGALLLEGFRVDRLEIEEESGVSVFSHAGAVQAQMAILADGSHAPVTRKMGLNLNRPDKIAMRRILQGDTGPVNRLEIHFQPTILPGYNWLFPLGDGRVNVGVFTTTRRTRVERFDLKAELERYISDGAVTDGRLMDATPAGPASAHPLRTAFGLAQTHANRVLVAGDAAELINPLSGEGIAPAMRSGEIAADCCRDALEAGNFSAGFLSRYTRRLKVEFGADYRAAKVLSKALSYPWLINRVFVGLRKDQRLARLIGDIITGIQSPRQALRLKVLLKLLAG